MSSKYLAATIKKAYQQDLAARVIRGLKDMKMTQETLAHLSGINRRTITNICSGHANPTIETLANIQAILHIELLR